MKDIKQLYLAAKTSGKTNDITSYTEAINELLESNPNGYMSSLEYIIKSDIGLQSLKEFVEKYGMPIASYNMMLESLNSCIEKCQSLYKDSSSYNEMVQYFENWRMDHLNAFMMFENFANSLPSDYVSTYYEFTEDGNQNSKLVVGMLKLFGEAAIPDLIITADNIGENAVKTVLEYVAGCEQFKNPTIYEWMNKIANDNINTNSSAAVVKFYKENCLTSIVEGIRSRKQKLYKESVILNKEDSIMEYSANDLETIQSLIFFKEYEMTWAEDLYKESACISKIQDEIYSLYEEFDGILNPDGTPTEESLDESKWFTTSQSKKTGEAPGYLKNNHDLNYGEDDDDNHKQGSENELLNSDSKEPGLDDFKRPSAEDISGSSSYSGFDDKDKDKDDDKSSKEPSSLLGSNTNNYYYYTYSNSLNKNSNSYNKAYDNSSNKGNNRQNEIHDNHSSGDDRGNHTNGETPAQESGNNINFTKQKLPKSLIDEKEKRFFIKPEISINKIFKVSKKDFDEIISKIQELNKKIIEIIDPYNKKYPIYGLTTSYDPNDNIFYKEKDGSMAIDVRTISGKYVFDFQLPAIVGISFQDFFADLEKNNPEEYHKYDEKDKWQLADAWWSNKFLDYDKSLLYIMADIEKDIKEKIKEIFGFGFWDDWDDIYYGFYVPAEYLYPDFKEDDIINEEVRTSKLAASISNNKIKHMIFKNKDERFKEAVGDADADRPESDHPIKDTLQDIDRELLKHQQKAKKKVQDIQNVGRAFVKPIKRTEQWISNMVANWKDADETKIKERMADPHARNNLFDAIKKAINAGSLLKAGLLLNPVFLFLTVTRGIGKNKKEFRLRNEMIGELKTELEIIDEKIKDADRLSDTKAKYRLMRLKNEINKKLLRVGGDPQWKKFI